ncbi:HNH endonuclease [Clostridium perfringens]|uniref:HNH endonuclease n=1 Tax=Clostridium perfringens TaxID=1502 RepID=UPI00240E7053|nr:HNH endonuclease [Clostridium perfringens]MDK0624325.1 hypothetical protein [Clostridium perfringens]MDK0844110.1 hypothetical protein [Clostridium perfringens]MDM0540256.1 hypothetical protein [Clostridium perfringens]MDM0888306.1 hypothetical protein [Clostridium perfringens]MDM0983746.1 hypothetical protein [Clostridium perfringens]
MAIRNHTRKLLWGKSANRCNFPECKEILSIECGEEKHTVIGEECHIIARSEDGPRGNSTLDKKQRDEYDNLILMCEKHHHIIDDNPEKYTVEILKDMKSKHEDWVDINLSQEKVEEIDFDFEDIKFDKDWLSEIYQEIIDNTDFFNYEIKDIEIALNSLILLDSNSRRVLHKLIKYYYIKENIDMPSIMNKLVNDSIIEEKTFISSIKMLEKHEFIEFEREDENDFAMAWDGSFIDMYSNINYRILNKECYFFRNGYILMLLGKFIGKKEFKCLIKNLEFEYL